MIIEFPFAYHILFNPPFFTLWASFAPFIFGESERSLGVRVLLEIFERREDLAWVFKIFHFIKVGWVRKTFLSMKLKLITCFLNQNHYFHQFQKKNYFIEFHETHFFTRDCRNTISPKYHERHLIIEWNMFLHDPTWKYHHMKPW